LQINGHDYKLELGYKNVLRLFKIFASEFPEHFKVEKGLEIVGLSKYNLELETETKAFILNEITNYLFDTSKAKEMGEKIFDFEHDFQYYYADFKRLGIDLIKENISWWVFDNLIQDIMLVDNTSIGSVIGFRTYEKPPKKYDENKEHRASMERKKKFALPNKNKDTVESGFDKLWKYTEGQVNKNE
jgi:hypothetical protein